MTPQSETCNGKDDDCDGQVDNGAAASCPERANATPTCTGGVCGFACNPGFGDCNRNAGNGCEADLSSNRLNCGACGRFCAYSHAAGICDGGTCRMGACDVGYRDCNTNPADGCEVNTNTDFYNCGACGRRCQDYAYCDQGQCRCNANYGFTDCNGACVNLQEDSNHCGACGRACTGGKRCYGGSCRCPDGLGDCDGNGTCETNLQQDEANCGACGNVCPAEARSVCSFGKCTCSDCLTNHGYVCCNGHCRDGFTDPRNCGACGNVCAGGKVCQQSRCVCPSGTRECGGVCVDTQYDPDHCGACGASCPSCGPGNARVCSESQCGCEPIDVCTNPRIC